MRIKLDIPLRLSELKHYFGNIPMSGDEKILINFISTDTRQLYKDDLFIALRGERFDSNSLAHIAKSIGAYIISEDKRNSDITVDSSNGAILALTKLYLKKLKPKHIIAITGSNGKTTTREILYELISDKFSTHATAGNLNNEFGVPFTVLSAPRGTEIMLLECGMNHSGELRRISAAISADTVIITNIGTAHIGNLGSRAAIASAKRELISKSTKFVFIPEGEELLCDIEPHITFSDEYISADYYLKHEQMQGEGELYKNGIFRTKLTVRPLGTHIYKCFAAAVACASHLGLSSVELKKRCNALPDTLSRLKISSIGSIQLFDDSYNASAESIRLALLTLKDNGRGSICALLGDIEESGSMARELHIECGKYCAEAGLHRLYAIGSYAQYYKEGAVLGGMDKENIFIYSRERAPECALDIVSARADIGSLLVKASRKSRLDKIIELIKEQMEL